MKAYFGLYGDTIRFTATQPLTPRWTPWTEYSWNQYPNCWTWTVVR